MTEPIFLGYVEYPDDGLRYVDGNFVYCPEFDVNGVHAALLDPASNYGKPAGMDLRARPGDCARPCGAPGCASWGCLS